MRYGGREEGGREGVNHVRGDGGREVGGVSQVRDDGGRERGGRSLSCER